MLQLKEVTVNKYKCFLNPQTMQVQSGTTWLIGKNEAGKTAFLEALAKFHYFDAENPDMSYKRLPDYPRAELKAYEESDPENSYCPVEAVYEISPDLMRLIAIEHGEGVLKSNRFSLKKSYSNIFTDFDLEVGAGEYVKGSEDNLRELIVRKYLLPRLPRFWYFDEYYYFPSQVSLKRYRDKQIDENFTREQYDIVHALFTLAGVDVNKLLLSENHEEYIAELEATSNSITDQFLEYWSTNQNLEIHFDIQTTNDDKLLNIRVRNNEHRLTLPLNKRSKGFVRFFSFLVWFSRVDKKHELIMLLDEPGLNLHAEAQKDMLRFIQEKMAPSSQVICSTHSPFLIDSNSIEDVRTVVAGIGDGTGSQVSTVSRETDAATVYPLQAALGYDMTRGLVGNAKTLLVDQISDFLYLTVISDALKAKGLSALSSDIRVMPLGGLEKLVAYNSLINGEDKRKVCLFSRPSSEHDDFNGAEERMYSQNQVLFYDEFGSKLPDAGVEELFSPKDFARIWTKSKMGTRKFFAPKLNVEERYPEQLSMSPEQRFRLASFLSSSPRLARRLSTETLERFELLFRRVNRLLED